MKRLFNNCFRKKGLLLKLRNENTELRIYNNSLGKSILNTRRAHVIQVLQLRRELISANEKLLEYYKYKNESIKIGIELRENIKNLLLQKVDEINNEISNLSKKI